MKTKQFNSEFRSDIIVHIVGKDDYRYDVLNPLFDDMGFGFVLPNSNIVVIDGERGLTKHELKWVEAHEMAHLILNHTEERNEKHEEQADTMAWILLINKGYDKAAKLIVKHYKERHGKDFDKYLLHYQKSKL